MDWTSILSTPLLSQDFLSTLSKEPELPTPTPNPPKPQKRCPTCSHKLQLADTTCRCGLRHCSAHRLPEAHNCTFDHMGDGRKLLETQVVKCVADKVKDRV